MPSEILNPVSDFVFKLIWGDQRNVDLLAGFLRTVAGLPEEEIARMTVVDPHLKRFWNRDKLGVVDVRVTTKTGKMISVEIQVQRDSKMRKRIIFYLAKLLWEQIRRGEGYVKLEQVIGIVICDHILIPEEPDYCNRYEIRNEKTGGQFTDVVKIITLELPKVPSEANDQAEWPWLRFFKCRTGEELNMLAVKFPELRRVVETLKELSMSPRNREIAEAQEKRRWAQIAREEDRYEEGLAEGLEAAAQKALREKLEAARKLKDMGLTPEQIRTALNLSPEEIAKIPVTVK